MAQSKVNVNVTYTTAAQLQTWLNNLGTDVVNSRVEAFSVAADGENIQGMLTLPSAVAIDDLSAIVEGAQT